MTFSSLSRLYDVQTLILVIQWPFRICTGYMIFRLSFSWKNDRFKPISVTWSSDSYFSLSNVHFQQVTIILCPDSQFLLYIDHLEPVPVSCRPDSYYLHTMTISIRSQLHDIQTPIFVMQWLFQAGLGYMMSKILFSWYNDFSNLSRLHDLQIFVKEMTIWSLSRLHYLQTPIFLVQWSFSAGYGYMISRLPFS